MRILIITPYFHPHPGGSQHYIEQLFSFLMRLDSEIKVDVLCYNTDQAPKKEKYKQFTVYRLSCLEFLPGQFAIPNYIELIKLIKKLKKKHSYQVVNAHTRFFESAWWAPIAAKYLDAESILTDHCASHPKHANPFISWVAKKIDRFLTPKAIKSYDQITVVSNATEQFLQEITQCQATIIYPGVKELSGPLQKEKVEKIQISFVGRMIASKNPGLVLSLAKTMIEEKSNLQFYFAGSGPLLKQLKKSESKRIKFLDQLEQNEVQKLLAQTDILIHPSSHHEGLPLTLLEAGLQNCAVLSTAQGGSKDVITHNKTGLIIEPNLKNASISLKRIIDDQALRQKLANNLNRHVVKNFDWKRSAFQFKQILPL